MFPDIDNLENNNIETFNFINENNNEFIFNPNNIDYYYFNPNKTNLIENEERPSKKVYNFLSTKINKNNDFPKNLDLEYDLQKKESDVKKKKIFNIIHGKKQLRNYIETNNEEKMKQNKNSFKTQKTLIANNAYSKGIPKVLENESANNNDSLLNGSFNDKSHNGTKKVKHDKYSDDNLRKKCKHLVLDSLMEFINKTIHNIYGGNIGNNVYRKELLTLNKSQKSNSNIIYNRIFANKKISDILSDNISTRYTNFPPQHNKVLIERLRNDEDENKRIYFNKLFNLTFKECIEHFIEKQFIEELEGMKCFEFIKESLGEDEEYIKIINYYLENFENIINNKNPRKPKKNRKSEQILSICEKDI